jgi:hypothetical protein
MRKRGVRLAVVVIDYLKFVRATDRYRGMRVYEIGEITGALKQLAKAPSLRSNIAQAMLDNARIGLPGKTNGFWPRFASRVRRIASLTALKAELQRMVTSCSHGRVDQCRVIEALKGISICEPGGGR